MYCPECGKPNEKTAKFCIKCGGRLPGTQQGQGPARPQPEAPSKGSGIPKLVVALLVMILVLLIIVAAEIVLLLTG